MRSTIDSRTKCRPVHTWTRPRQSYRFAARSLVVALLSMGARDARAAVIAVTSTEQKISSQGGCSLQEAIYSANFDNNVAISGYNGSTPVEVVTQCAPGSGADIIVLPAGALLQMNKIIDDAINPAGPTATPIITSNITILAYGATLERIGTGTSGCLLSRTPGTSRSGERTFADFGHRAAAVATVAAAGWELEVRSTLSAADS